MDYGSSAVLPDNCKVSGFLLFETVPFYPGIFRGIIKCVSEIEEHKPLNHAGFLEQFDRQDYYQSFTVNQEPALNMTFGKKDKNIIFLNPQAVMLMLSAVATILTLIWVLKYSFYGIDFTDEAFYLVWISNPFLYNVSVAQFGYIYHPLFLILSGDIASLRQANILITFGLSCWLTYIFLKPLAPENSTQKIDLPILTAGLATTSFTSLIYLGNFLPTPSYNSLAFQGVLITAIGLLLADKLNSFRSVVGWVLIGTGGWLVFMAKPSTALALSVGVLVYLVIARKFSVRMILLAIASALVLLLISALLIDGSIAKFAERVRLGVESIRIMEAKHTTKTIRQAMTIFGVVFFTIAIRYVVVHKKFAFALLLISALLVDGSIIKLTESLLSGVEFMDGGQSKLIIRQGLVILGVTFFALVIKFIFKNKEILSNISSDQKYLALLFFVMPLIYSFGTNTPYWQHGVSASIFWFFASFTILCPFDREKSKWSYAIPFVLIAQAVTATFLQKSFDRPSHHRHGSIVKIGASGSNLILSAGYAQYFEEAKAAAQNAGFQVSTPMIDLSGYSPGILFALGAESIGLPWIIGGNPGSLSLAKAALGRTSCKQIATAWVLFEPDGPRSIPTELLLSLGAEFPANYKFAGSWQTAEGAGGYVESRTQVLYSPIAPDKTLEVCQAMRKKGEE